MKRFGTPDSFDKSLIAPCGMNCGLCIAHLRDRRPCHGCAAGDAGKSHSAVVCRIRNCRTLEACEPRFCFSCAGYPCAGLRHLDKRYRTKYGMSMTGNLEHIRDKGIEAFIRLERERWACPQCGGIVCVHRDRCIYCDRVRK